MCGASRRHRYSENLTICHQIDVLNTVLQDYDEQADVWSVGILMWQLLTGRFPFWDDIKSLSLQQARCRTAFSEPLSCLTSLSHISKLKTRGHAWS